MNLRGIDLNLLPVLDALLKEGSVSGAARRLGLSQPATSHALNRLRHLFDDPLMVRIGASMRLTSRAQALMPLCESACAAAGAVIGQDVFDPAQAQLSFSIATPDYLALLLGQHLLPLLRQQAPGVSVRFVDAGLSVREQIVAGEVDLAVIAFIQGVVEGLSVAVGFVDPLVCVVAKGHPLADREQATWADIAACPRLEIDATPDGLIPAARGQAEPVQIAASHLMVLPLLAARTGTLAVVPRSLAVQAADMAPMSLLDLDSSARSLSYCLAWHGGHDRDQGHIWLRSLLGDLLFRALAPDEITALAAARP